MRHSCAHVMARAVMRLRKGVQLAFGPTVEGGFYYDFDLEEPLSEDDFPAIEAEMKKIIKANEPFERLEEPRDKALQICRDLEQAYKVEHIQEGLGEHESVSFYRQGEFLDLCRGPHVPSAGAIGAFKLLSIAGAYWKGDASRQQLQRLYGTAFFNKEDLAEHLRVIEEAEKTRSPRARQTAGSVHHQSAGRFGADSLAAQRGHDSRSAGDVRQRRAGATRLFAGLHAAHRPHRAVQDFGPLSVLPGQPVRTDQDAG